MHIQVQDLSHADKLAFMQPNAALKKNKKNLLLRSFKVHHESVNALTLRSISITQALHGHEAVFGKCLLLAIHANITGMSSALKKKQTL